jgi:hypothetical protein
MVSGSTSSFSWLLLNSGRETETFCKDFVFTIFIGCWVFSGTSKVACMHTWPVMLKPLMLTALCFAIALGVMAFIPRPVDPEAALESLPLARTRLPSNPDLFKAGSPTDERRAPLSPIRTGLPVVTYNNAGNAGELSGESLSPDCNTSQANIINREAITPEPPHLWQGFPSKHSSHGNEDRTRGGTISTRNAPGGFGGSTSGSVPQRADSFGQKYLSYSPTSSRVPVRSRASMIRPAVGGKSTPAAKFRPNRISIPKPRHDALPPIPLRNPPSLVTMPRDHAIEYPRAPRVFPALSNNSALIPPWDDSQPTSPEQALITTPDVYSFHPAPENVHSVMVEPPPYVLLPSVSTPRVERFQDLSAFWGPSSPRDTSAGNNASFVAGGSNAPPVRSASQPRRTVQRPGEGTTHHAGNPPVKKVRFSRRSSDEQVLDQTQWWGLVRGAATKP